MTHFKAIALLATLAASVLPALAGTVDPHHPVLGSWVYTYPNGGCAETYDFKADGTTRSTSAEEVAESDYEIAPQPSSKGFYTITDRVTRDNGKKDCSGEISTPGKVFKGYVQVHPQGDMLVICQDESLQACFGPLRRKP